MSTYEPTERDNEIARNAASLVMHRYSCGQRGQDIIEPILAAITEAKQENADTARLDALKKEFCTFDPQWFVNDAANNGPCDMTPWHLLAAAALKASTSTLRDQLAQAQAAAEARSFILANAPEDSMISTDGEWELRRIKSAPQIDATQPVDSPETRYAGPCPKVGCLRPAGHDGAHLGS